MLQLISKLQHNTYEKGEFSDEQPRNLDETIQVIKDFPWDAERALTDIQLTGPSVTIQDDDLNYLKLGLYFNGKFCVYYLDRDNHLYEYHAPTIDEACNLVKDFFNQTIDLKPFEKHFFNIGNQPHFITSDFVYRVNIIRVFIMVAGFSIYLLSVFLLAYFNTRGPVDIYFKCFFAAFIILMGCAMGYFVLNNMKSRHQYLKISRGNNLFSYGWDEQHITTYDKLNIEVINYSVGNKGAIVNVEITFKDGKSIKPKYVIDGDTLLGKFPEKLEIPKNVR